jgi:hypothetical protein
LTRRRRSRREREEGFLEALGSLIERMLWLLGGGSRGIGR